MPFDESAATAVPSVTGSKNASWRVPEGAVTVIVVAKSQIESVSLHGTPTAWE